MKVNETLITTTTSLRSAADAINRALTRAGARDIGPVTQSSNPLEKLDEPPAIELYANKIGMMGGWAVQVYIWDRGDYLDIGLRALGNSGFGTAMHGLRDEAQIGKSEAVVARIVDVLRELDSKLTVS